MRLADLINVVKAVIILKQDAEVLKYLESLFGKASPYVKFLDEIEAAGPEKIFTKFSMDERKDFLKKVSSALITHPKIQNITKTVEMEMVSAPGAGTTTANVGAFPVPLGQESPGRKKHHESVTKLMGIGAYQITESTDVEAELAEYSNQLDS